MAPPKKSTRASRTKAETTAKMDEVMVNLGADPESPGEKAVRKAGEAALRAKAAGLSVEEMVQSLSVTGLNLTKAVSTISEQLQTAASQVAELQKAKELFEKDMEALHGKEVAASAIEDLVEEFESKKRELEDGLAETTRMISAARLDVQNTWVREQQQHQQMIMDRNRAMEENRKREEEAYSYQKTQERAKAEKDFQNKMADLERANNLAQADKDRNWAAREAELKKQEQEVTDLRARVAGIENEIKAAVEKQVSIVGASMKRDHKFEIDSLTKDFQAKEIVSNNKIENLTTQLAAANTVIANLNSQLQAAQAKVAEIASNALQAASGRQALTEVQALISQQGANASKTKA